MFDLPVEITSMILDFAGVTENWKRRFSNDVLPEIDTGLRYIGFDTSDGLLDLCPNCYAYGTSRCRHERYMHVSFEDMKRYSGYGLLRQIPSIPKAMFEWCLADESGRRDRTLCIVRYTIAVQIGKMPERDAKQQWFR